MRSSQLRPLRLLMTLATAGALWLLTPGVGVAHSDLISSDPSDGAHLESAPAMVSLTFGDAVIADFTQVRVTLDGTQIVVPDPTTRDNVVTVTLPADASAGHYTVAYQIVSADSHPVAGEVSFVASRPSGTLPTPASSASVSTTRGDATMATPPGARAQPTTSGETSETGVPLTGSLGWTLTIVAAVGTAIVAWLAHRRARGRS